MTFLKRYLIVFVIFLLLDALWLGVIAQRYYQAQIGFIMARDPNWAAAGIFYLLYCVGLVVFVISPALQQPNLTRAVLRGALWGFFTYATYDLTNLATLAGWPVMLTLVDMAWGTCLNAATTLLTLTVGRRLRI